jgi:hypothetical protein
MQAVDGASRFAASRDLGREDAGAAAAFAQFHRQHRLDLQQRGAGRDAEPLAAERAHEARADHQRLEFIDVEHQRRNVRALAQHVADPGLALDRHARRLQVRDVAIDRAQRDAEGLGEAARRERGTASTQGMDDQEQAVGAAHAA